MNHYKNIDNHYFLISYISCYLVYAN